MLRLRRLARSRGLATWTKDAIPAETISTLHELGVAAGEAYGDLKSLGSRDAATGAWTWTTYAERATNAKALGNALASYGVERGDRVAVISRNRAEFATTMYGAYACGAAHVPMYEQQKPSEWEYILNDSEAKVLFVSKKELLPAAREAAKKHAVKVLCFEETEDAAHNYLEALAAGAALDEVTTQRPASTDLASLIYTSGTTGRPKGVELTHDNLVWNSLTMRDNMYRELELIGRAPTAPVRSMAVLPWAHIYGQTLELHGMLAAGHEVALCSDPTAFLAEVGEAKPYVLFAVPALYNRIYDGFQAKRAAMPSNKQALVDKAIALGLKNARAPYSDPNGALEQPPSLSLFEKAQHFVLDKLILSKVRDMLGGEIVFCGNGGAAIANDVRNFVDACGIPMTNGYGLTETSPVLAKEDPMDLNNFSKGSIGRALPGVDLKTVDADGKEVAPGEPGELVACSRGVMRGYWRNEEATAEVLYEDGGKTWFRTGDQCVVEANGHVRIVGRIKEQYKLANGKYVVPTPLEEQLARSPYIAQAFLYGDNKEANVALVAPDWVQIADKFGEPGSVQMVAPFTYEPAAVIETLALEHQDAIKALVESEVGAHSGAFKGYEKPASICVLKEGFNAKRGMTTPKMSVKRASVLAAHMGDIDALYEGPEAEALAA
mmetsp:Transcript_26912/g.83735  ORF Transcript_26912/g.83735 Transcript_26912/m.83735 type:complete len:664 (-) Transcript_26912:58-2049(-)